MIDIELCRHDKTGLNLSGKGFELYRGKNLDRNFDLKRDIISSTKRFQVRVYLGFNPEIAMYEVYVFSARGHCYFVIM